MLRRMTERPTRADTTTTTFAVERYWPGVTDVALADAADAARDAALAMAGEGLAIRFVDAFVARDDEVVLTLFEAPSRQIAQAAIERAGLPYDRITQLDRANGATVDRT